MLQRYRAAALPALTAFTALGLAAVCVVTSTTPAVAQNKSDATLDRVKAAVQKTLGADAPIKSVARTPVPGLYEVAIGGEIIYADEKAQYVILGGNLVDTKTRQNLTEARQSELNKVDFAKLPFDRAIKYVKGNGARKIAVFSDPNCPYCKRFEDTLKTSKLDNITVYTFLYPVLGPDSDAKSKAIWCAPDRLKAWHDWMLDKKAPPTAGARCDDAAIEQNVALGRQFNVTGTPTIILADGRRLPGAVPAEELEKALASVR
ncbi:DsbC family protein [Pandoraea nosoerga]|uniref:Thiol:disulfide interchange protein n=1 Tax=Pandoraea nosoerga TaxID=2508296 RepID=A0A5E4VU73_9BURK|nr:DsbC family protein [Pandoraea nosoerga]MBN4667909.1 DsbC family protein [Pandoraea nosoerga]MBN4677781.1 DsbC family protein [Pandoraea nosoerga]MBN4682916.1 DsbC family protein [Pandoraea nosoerga]MBN4746929.1 DsbC family protein [Pandoraea nosoerga]VVE15928.1 thiol:disulfide interchange protein [Pandoraea nosoerga]